MSRITNIHWGDGYLIVEPIVPDNLKKILRYWHRGIAFDGFGKRVATGEYRTLYEITQSIDDHQQFTQKLTTMPGFMHTVKNSLKEDGYQANIIDERTPAPNPDIAAAMVGLYDYQYECAYTTLMSGGGIVASPTGWGKCVGPDTKVIHAEGTVSQMGNVKIGDLLLGDDSTPRKVMSRVDGFGPMYQIKPKNGIPFTAASHHILCLVKSGRCKCDDYPEGHIVCLTVKDYLNQPRIFKHVYKLYKVSADWNEKPVTVDPYWLGLWLGAGDVNQPNVRTSTPEIITAIQAYADSLRLLVTTRDSDGMPAYSIGGGPEGVMYKQLQAYGLMEGRIKFIPEAFKTNSREIRLQVLAGLADSLGTLDSGTDFDFISSNTSLLDDIAFVARSLGFSVYRTKHHHKWFTENLKVYSLRITGETSLIPTRVAHKMATVHVLNKHALDTGFTVSRIEDGPYVGVTLDGNHRYLLSDFTVTHNTHIIGAIAKAYPHAELLARNTPITVVCAPDKDIVSKNYRDLCSILPDRDIGIIMSGQKKVFSNDIQLITLSSLHHIDPDDVGLLIVDEVHSAASEERAERISNMRKAIKYAMSATPTGRFDGRDKVTEGLFGPVVYSRTYKEGVDDGALVPIRVLWYRLPEPAMGLDAYLRYSQRESKYRHGMYRDVGVQQTISNMIKRIPNEMQTLCIMRHTEQLNMLVPGCPGVAYVHGETSAKALQKSSRYNLAPVSKKERNALYEQMRDGVIRKVFSTWVYKQGVNFPQLEVIINAGGGGSDIVARQIPGRESRNIDGKEESWLIDFYHDWDRKLDKRGVNRAGPLLADDRSREKAYTALGFDQNWISSLDEIPFLKDG